MPQHISGSGARPRDLRGEAGEQLFKHGAAAWLQGVMMAPVRHATAMHPNARQVIPIHDGDLAVSVGKHPSGQQPGHTRAQHHCVVTGLRHRTSSYRGATMDVESWHARFEC
jgi:hypothetical protein